MHLEIPILLLKSFIAGYRYLVSPALYFTRYMISSCQYCCSPTTKKRTIVGAAAVLEHHTIICTSSHSVTSGLLPH